MIGKLVDYDPNKHKGLPLYRMVNTYPNNGRSIGTGMELVTDKETLDNAHKVPYYFAVRQADVDSLIPGSIEDIPPIPKPARKRHKPAKKA